VCWDPEFWDSTLANSCTGGTQRLGTNSLGSGISLFTASSCAMYMRPWFIAVDSRERLPCWSLSSWARPLMNSSWSLLHRRSGGLTRFSPGIAYWFKSILETIPLHHAGMYPHNKHLRVTIWCLASLPKFLWFYWAAIPSLDATSWWVMLCSGWVFMPGSPFFVSST